MRVELEVCDVCERPPGGSPDHLLPYHPCGHMVCDECHDRKKQHLCDVCGVGKDGYADDLPCGDECKACNREEGA